MPGRAERLATIGAKVDPGSRVAELTAAETQLVEIAKALALDPSVLILDEPTAALDADEVDHLFEQVRAIRARGTAIVYISHRIPEVEEIADRLTVLRDGEARGTFGVEDVDEAAILKLIAGRELAAVFPEKLSGAPGATVLSVEGLSGEGFDDVSLSVSEGEIVGIAGVAGNGQRELVRALAGLGHHTGTVEVAGSRCTAAQPAPGPGRRRLLHPLRPPARGHLPGAQRARERGRQLAGAVHQLRLRRRRLRAHGAGRPGRATGDQDSLAGGRHRQPLRRQPAEGRLRPGDAGPAQGPDLRRADPGRRRRRPGRDLRPAARARRRRLRRHRLLLRRARARGPLRPGRDHVARPGRRHPRQRRRQRGRDHRRRGHRRPRAQRAPSAPSAARSAGSAASCAATASRRRSWRW